MKCRERLLSTLRCEKADRPPFVGWLGLNPWDKTLERWRAESGLADLAVDQYFGFDPFFAILPLEYGPFPGFEEKVLRDTGDFLISRDRRGITRRNRKDRCSIPEFIDHPIKTSRDWQDYKEEHLQSRLEERLRMVDGFIDEIEDQDVAVQAGVFPFGAFGTLRDMLGTQECLYAFYDTPQLVHDIINTYVDLWLSLYEEVEKRVHIDRIHIWEDMSGKQGSLISMAMVEEFMMPHYDRLAAFAERYGIPVISVDSDGRVDELVETMVSHGVNAFMPFEVQAGNDIEEFRRRYPNLAIFGGLDKNALAKSKKEIHEQLDKAERMFAAGGYIVGFDHKIPPDVPWANYRYVVEEIRKMIMQG